MPLNLSLLQQVLHQITAQQGFTQAHVARQEAERDDGARVVGAVHVLRDAHAPEHEHGVRLADGDGQLTDTLRLDAADGDIQTGRTCADGPSVPVGHQETSVAAPA